MFARLRRFARAEKGLAALEFALIAPMMIFLLFASVELIDALDVNSRAENSTASLADIVARDNGVTNAEVSDYWSATNILMYPEGDAALDIRITSIQVVAANQARVVWSEVRHNYGALAANSLVTLPTAMMVTGTSVIRVETTYHYMPPLRFLFPGSMDLHHTSYRRSRLVDPIPRCASGC